MPLIVVDAMDNAEPWRALAPDGVTPSTVLSLTVDRSRARPGAGSSARIVADTHALNHSCRRAFSNALDLTDFDELRLWLLGSRAADGTPARPFCLEVQLGSAALPPGASGNAWQRFLPVAQAGFWEPTRLSIAELPAAVRRAISVLEVRCVAPGIPFTCNVDDIVAVRDAMITDVDAALLAKLDRLLSINGAAVPAVLHPGSGVLVQQRPYFEITHYDIAYSRERTEAVRPRGDHSNRGYALRQPGNAYELYYQITANADDRLTQSTMLDFVLRRLPPRGEIIVNNYPLPIEAVNVEPANQIGGFRSDRLPLFYRISTRQDVGAGEFAVPARNVIVDTDFLTSVATSDTLDARSNIS